MLTFSDIIGHDEPLRRLAGLRDRNAIPNTLLFSGPEGIGKRLVAMAFLASLFCKGDPRPCGACAPCRQIAADTFPDLVMLLPNDKGVIPIGNAEKREPGSVRWLVDRLARRSVSGRAAVLIDGIDRATDEGQNALLKSIEEPGEGAVIVLVTADRSRVLPTIRSRCFELAFRPLDDQAIMRHLSRGGVDEDDARFIAHLAQGSFSAAGLLMEGTTCEEFLALAGEISAFLIRGELLTLDLGGLQKRLSAEAVVDTLTAIYRLNMRVLTGASDVAPAKEARGALYPVFYERVCIDNLSMVTALVKIFLALRAGLRYNLNLRNSLKGSLYRAREGAAGDDASPDTLPERG